MKLKVKRRGVFWHAPKTYSQNLRIPEKHSVLNCCKGIMKLIMTQCVLACSENARLVP